MTDNEIVKALEDAIRIGDAPIGKYWGCMNSKLTAKETVDLINRQKAEIESISRKARAEITILLAERDVANQEVDRLSVMVIELQNQLKTAKAEIERLKNHIQEGINLAKEIPEMVSIVKAEAYKECIERVKKLMEGWGDLKYYNELIQALTDLDNLLKELVG